MRAAMIFFASPSPKTWSLAVGSDDTSNRNDRNGQHNRSSAMNSPSVENVSGSASSVKMKPSFVSLALCVSALNHASNVFSRSR